MPNFNYLKHNESEFPHIRNVDVYKYDNDFDYGRFDYTQMALQICSVPWDMGEAHIGSRTISGIGNVVHFGSESERDKWFDAIPDSECYRFTTKFKELHRSLEIDVPIPYDMCAKHNYLRVQYNKFANDDSPVQFESDDGLREWFWFIREVEFLAPNTTRLHLLDDAFQTWIYDIDISGMVLERGHAPMFATRADDFLNYPIDNNEYLLTPDVDFGSATQVKHIDALVLNAGDMYACIATTADPLGDFGSKSNDDWNCPAWHFYNNNGQPSVYVFAMLASDLNTFLTNADASIPQFKQTIQAVFFASKDLLTISTKFQFADTDCYSLFSERKTLDFVELEKSLFDYPARYADMAKLYTSPYAHIEITDENGNADIIKIEDTEGIINVSAMLSIAYPFVNIDAHLLGIGGNGRASVTFKNIDSHTFDISGQWYETLRTWNVPTFGVILDAATEYDYSTHFDRKQAVTDYTTAQTNANATADTESANTALQVAANSANAAVSNTSAAGHAANTVGLNASSTIADNGTTMSNALSTIAANDMQGSIAAGSGFLSGIVGSIGVSASTGAPSIGVTGMANAIIGAQATLAKTAVANGLTMSQAANTIGNNINHQNASDLNTNNNLSVQQTATNDYTDVENDLIDGQTANSVATQKANASRIANAAQSAIDNGIAQAALREPFMYGNFANGETAATKPIGLFAHIVTESKSAISSAGDEFARYGYALDKQWNFNGDWNIGKYFTYWKLRDFWVSNLNVPDMYMDRLRFFLFGGVTVWRKPEYIGKIDIYDNF